MAETLSMNNSGHCKLVWGATGGYEDCGDYAIKSVFVFQDNDEQNTLHAFRVERVGLHDHEKPTTLNIESMGAYDLERFLRGDDGENPSETKIRYNHEDYAVEESPDVDMTYESIRADTLSFCLFSFTGERKIFDLTNDFALFDIRIDGLDPQKYPHILERFHNPA